MTDGIAYCRDCGRKVIGDAVYDERGTLKFVRHTPSGTVARYRCYICEYNRRWPGRELLLGREDIARIETNERLARAVEMAWEYLWEGKFHGARVPWDLLPVVVDDEVETKLLAGAVYTRANRRRWKAVRWRIVLTTVWVLLLTLAFLVRAAFTVYITTGFVALMAILTLALVILSLYARRYTRMQGDVFHEFADLELNLLLEKEGIIEGELAWWRVGGGPSAALSKVRNRLSGRERLSELTPREFEEAVAEIFRKFDYRAEVTPYVRDRGVDLLLEDQEGTRFAVQIKQFASGLSVGRPELQKLQGAMLDSRADRAILVTLSSFSEPARRYAREHGIRLIDGDELINMLPEAQSED